MILGERFYQMSNAIFHYDLTPVEFMVYNYLVSCAGQKDVCWPSVHRIALNCNCSENTVRKAIDALVKKRFIRRVSTYENWIDGHSRQTNNTYYILDLPPVKNTAATVPAKKYRQVESTTASPPPPRGRVSRRVRFLATTWGAYTSDKPRKPWAVFQPFSDPGGEEKRGAG